MRGRLARAAVALAAIALLGIGLPATGAAWTDEVRIAVPVSAA